MCFHRRKFLEGTGAALAMTFCGCRTAPISGRKQFVVIPEAQELGMAEQSFAQILATESPSTNARWQQIVTRVGTRISQIVNKPNFQWDFRLFDSSSQNAFALPGGKVGVYEGIMPICQTEAGVAVVVSHEIAHTIARHGSERISQQAAVQGVQSVLGYAISGSSDAGRNLVMNAYGAAAQYGLILPYSRRHELEADSIGIQIMAQAGYDPAEAPRFWQRFGAASGPASPPIWASTHPSDDQRASGLLNLLPQASVAYQSAPVRVGLGETL